MKIKPSKLKVLASVTVIIIIAISFFMGFSVKSYQEEKADKDHFYEQINDAAHWLDVVVTDYPYHGNMKNATYRFAIISDIAKNIESLDEYGPIFFELSHFYDTYNLTKEDYIELAEILNTIVNLRADEDHFVFQELDDYITRIKEMYFAENESK